ncbi:terpene cyclase/mutase family protein [Micromonospora sp. CPCC 205371]|nr:terpene cyclase/mutase family protein [Micromonospora sp. CPCC 205371]
MERIDLKNVDDCVDRALNLLRRTYRSTSQDVGGWYHNLDSAAPGPSATSVGMASFLLHGRPFDQINHCLAFLRERQIQSADSLIDGGWAVNTSFGQPVSEATALVARLLSVTHTSLTPVGPDAGRAYRWLINNQNDDGGWGSFKGQESRVWLTAMVIRALAELDPYCLALRRGTEWLTKHRDPESRAWGERPSQPPTVTHTAYVVTALVDSRLGLREQATAEAITAGFDWLHANLDPRALHDDRARTESYNVTKETSDGVILTWQTTVWHHALPFALGALVRQPQGRDIERICRAVQTVVDTQLPDGRWPSADSAAALSVWTIWPFLEALSDVRSRLWSDAGYSVLALTDDALVLRQAGQRRSLGWLFWRVFRAGSQRWLAKRWATAILLLMIVIGGLLVLLDRLGWQEFALGLLFPVALVVVQVAMSRSFPGE